MEICVISFGLRRESSGYTLRTLSILRELSKHFDKINVLEFGSEHNDIKQSGNITFIGLETKNMWPKSFSNIMENIFTFDPFRNLIFQFLSFLTLYNKREYIHSADVVLVESCMMPAGNIISKLFQKKVVLDTHCINKLLATHYKKRRFLVYLLRTFFWDLLERLTIRLSNIVITVSKKETEYIINEYGTPRSNVILIPNIVSRPKIPCYNIKELKHRYGLDNKIVVTFAGDLTSVQNIDAVDYIIKELAPYFWKKRKDVVFLIIGRGKERFKGITPNVLFTGFVKEIEPLLDASDVHIAPSRVGAGTKMKVLTYLSYDKPIILTPVSAEGLEAYLDPKFNSVCSIEDFASCLEKTLAKKPKVRLRVDKLQRLHEDFKNGIKELLNAIK